MIYIIHIGDRLEEPKHVVGYCEDERLKERMREHARGKGSKKTRVAIEEGQPMYLSRLLPGFGPHVEVKLRRSKRVIDLCQMCCPLTDPIDRTPFLIEPRKPLDPPTWDPIAFRLEAHKKRYPP